MVDRKESGCVHLLFILSTFCMHLLSIYYVSGCSPLQKVRVQCVSVQLSPAEDRHPPPPKEILEDTVGEHISGAASLPPDPK